MNRFKITFVGPFFTGTKTSLIKRIISKQFDNNIGPTAGISFSLLDVILF